MQGLEFLLEHGNTTEWANGRVSILLLLRLNLEKEREEPRPPWLGKGWREEEMKKKVGLEEEGMGREQPRWERRVIWEKLWAAMKVDAIVC